MESRLSWISWKWVLGTVALLVVGLEVPLVAASMILAGEFLKGVALFAAVVVCFVVGAVAATAMVTSCILEALDKVKAALRGDARGGERN
ncbi:MAG TPA: hypothetical protein ENF26_03025 [Methanomicrobia archaeon]|nr:hypothetical protein [Methanomicrobia archaeon]HEX59105.1 hypothetical protein [Methanomicrobia archaeon]